LRFKGLTVVIFACNGHRDGYTVIGTTTGWKLTTILQCPLLPSPALRLPSATTKWFPVYAGVFEITVGEF